MGKANGLWELIRGYNHGANVPPTEGKINQCGVVVGQGGLDEDAQVRLPVCALTAFGNAEKFVYIPDEVRVEYEKLPDAARARVDAFLCKYKDTPDRKIKALVNSIFDKGKRVALLPLGKTTKRDKKLLFSVLCLASNCRESERRTLDDVIGPNVRVRETPYNQVWLSKRMYSELAKVLYGQRCAEAARMFLSDLTRLSHQECLMRVPYGKSICGDELEIYSRSVPFSVSKIIKSSDGGYDMEWADESEYGEMECESQGADAHQRGGSQGGPIGIVITLSDIFFYENQRRYSYYNVQNVVDGLCGKNGDALGNTVFYLSRFLPLVAMQRKRGEGFSVSFPMETIVPGYNESTKQSKYKSRKRVLAIGVSAGQVLKGGDIAVLGNRVKCNWDNGKKSEQSGGDEA